MNYPEHIQKLIDIYGPQVITEIERGARDAHEKKQADFIIVLHAWDGVAYGFGYKNFEYFHPLPDVELLFDRHTEKHFS